MLIVCAHPTQQSLQLHVKHGFEIGLQLLLHDLFANTQQFGRLAIDVLDGDVGIVGFKEKISPPHLDDGLRRVGLVTQQRLAEGKVTALADQHARNVLIIIEPVHNDRHSVVVEIKAIDQFIEGLHAMYNQWFAHLVGKFDLLGENFLLQLKVRFAQLVQTAFSNGNAALFVHHLCKALQLVVTTVPVHLPGMNAIGIEVRFVGNTHIEVNDFDLGVVNLGVGMGVNEHVRSRESCC